MSQMILSCQLAEEQCVMCLLPTYEANKKRCHLFEEGIDSEELLNYLATTKSDVRTPCGGSPPGLFTANSVTGEIFLNRLLSKDRPPALKIIVAVHDNGRPSLSSTVTVSFVVRPPAPPGSQELVIRSSAQTQRPWDLSSIIITVLAGSCTLLLVAIVAIATTCNKSKEPKLKRARGQDISQLERGRRPECGLIPSHKGGKFQAVDVQQYSSAASLCGLNAGDSGGSPNSEHGSSQLCRFVVDKLRGTDPELFPPVSGFGHQALHPVTIWKGKSFTLNKSEHTNHPQDRFSGKDSGKGDSDFNDSDSDISGIGLSKKGALSQRHNGLWSCTSECKVLGHSDRCWSPSTGGSNTYSSTTASQHLNTFGKSTSLPRDPLRKDTYYQALLPKTAGLQSVYQKVSSKETETVTSIIVPLYQTVGLKGQTS
eukprot:gi/632952155/ref/XP_007891692.1/ PREDICTED: protocadherin-8-like [Callorhinchus milii]